MYEKNKKTAQGVTFNEFNQQKGATLIMLHGNSLQSALFEEVAKSSLLSDYRIILLEFPGHGNTLRSDNPEKDYSVTNYINLTTAFIKQHQITNYVLFGHSLGGHIAINSLPELKGIKGLAISGTPPLSMPPQMELSFLPNPSAGLAFRPDLSPEEITVLASNFLDENHEYLSKVKASISETDPLVRPMIGKSIATEQKYDEKQLVEQVDFPVAIFHGEKDKLVNPDYLEGINTPMLWEKKIQVIKNGTHCPFLDNGDEFTRILAEFLRFCL